MVEQYDDSDIREKRISAKELTAMSAPMWIDTGNPEQDSMDYSRRFDAWVAINTTKCRPCPYCIAAKKGGAHGDIDYHEQKGLVHKVRVITEETKGNCLTLLHLEAACGAVFKEIVDSSD